MTGLGEGPALSWSAQVPLESDTGQLSVGLSPALAGTGAVVAERTEDPCLRGVVDSSHGNDRYSKTKN